VTRTDRRTLARQLRAEGLSQRAIARRLGVGKDTVRRDLEQDPPSAAPDDAPPGEPDTAAAPQASPAEAEEAAPGGAPQDASVATLPRRVADPLAGMDMSQWRALRRDLAVLAQSGLSAEALVHQAIVTLAHQYRQDLAEGRLPPGQRFLIRSMDLYLAPAEAGRTAAAEPPTATT
jgi:transcriptional regulator with XRE-family HTH domain